MKIHNFAHKYGKKYQIIQIFRMKTTFLDFIQPFIGQIFIYVKYRRENFKIFTTIINIHIRCCQYMLSWHPVTGLIHSFRVATFSRIRKRSNPHTSESKIIRKHKKYNN